MSDREESPDWLRSFQPPTEAVTLSSDSEPLAGDKSSQQELSLNKSAQTSDEDEDDKLVISKAVAKAKSSNKGKKVQRATPTRTRKARNLDDDEGQAVEKVAPKKGTEPSASYHNLLALSSDSEPLTENSLKRDDDVCDGESPKLKPHNILERLKEEDPAIPVRGRKSPRTTSKEKTPTKQQKLDIPKKEEKDIDTASDDKKPASAMKEDGNGVNVEAADEEASVKRIEPHVSSSSLPLVFPERVNRLKALVECEGNSIDLSGDIGAVGRVVISDTPSGGHEMYLDLKGTMYKTSIVPSRTFCVVSFGQSEAKVEAIMNDFIQLKPQFNVDEAETMVEGTLDGFSFDSEDEAEKIPKANNQADKNEGAEENGKTKGKAEKKTGTVRKRGKAAGEKQPPSKRGKKKTQVSKKGKSKK